MVPTRMDGRWLVIVAFFLVPAASAAQIAHPAPRVAIGAGAGLAVPFHGDYDFTPWAWDADVRLALSGRGSLEVAVGEWRHSDTRVARNIQLTPPPGTIDRLEQSTARTQRMLQANLLFAGSAGRVRVSAGGGVGVLQHDRRTRTVTSGCSPGVSCGSSDSKFSNAGGTAQAVGGLEVAVARGLAVHGQARFIVNVRDVGSSEVRVTAGARWGFGG
jgi:hypothetical protein